MARRVERGEVWLVDLGLAAKVRPCLILSIPATGEDDRVLTTIVPHTTSVRGTKLEVSTSVRFLRSGAFDIQQIASIPTAKFIRRLGTLDDVMMKDIVACVKHYLALD